MVVTARVSGGWIGTEWRGDGREIAKVVVTVAFECDWRSRSEMEIDERRCREEFPP
jgi:hypothetical protein